MMATSSDAAITTTDMDEASKASKARDLFERGEKQRERSFDSQGISEAIDLFEKAFALGSIEAAYELGVIYTYEREFEDPEKAFHCFEMAANAGHRDAAFYLAHCYEIGKGTDRDPKHSLQFYEVAIQPDPKYLQTKRYEAFRTLADFFLEGNIVAKDEKRGIELLTQAAEKYEHAKYQLGMHFLKNKQDPEQIKLGIDWLKKAAADDLMDAGYQLGKIYEEGVLVPQDLKTAFDYYSAASEHEYAPDADFKRGHFHEHDLGGAEKNLSTALHRYRLAAKLGHQEANYKVGIMLEQGIVEKANIEDAIVFYLEAARLGHPEACFRVGQYFADGPKKDLRRSADYFTQGKDKGHLNCMLYLANYYSLGIGVIKDEKVAFGLYQNAVEKFNNPFAKYCLGRCYLFGYGIDKDVVRGVELILQASKENCAEASKFLPDLPQYLAAEFKNLRELQSEVVKLKGLLEKNLGEQRRAEQAHKDSLKAVKDALEVAERKLSDALKTQKDHERKCGQLQKNLGKTADHLSKARTEGLGLAEDKEQLTRKITSLMQDIKSLTIEKEQLIKTQALTTQDKAKQKDLLKDLDSQLRDALRMVSELRQEKTRIEQAIQEKNLEIKQLKIEKEALRAELQKRIEQQRDKIRTLEENLNSFSGTLKQHKAMEQKLKQEFQAEREKLLQQISEKSAQLNAQKQMLDQRGRDLNQLRHKLGLVNQRNEVLTLEATENQKKLDQLTRRAEVAEVQARALGVQFYETLHRAQQAEGQVQALSLREKAALQDRDNANKDRDQANRVRDNTDRECEVLRGQLTAAQAELARRLQTAQIEHKILQDQSMELGTLREQVVEVQSLRTQVTELNMLRDQVAAQRETLKKYETRLELEAKDKKESAAMIENLRQRMALLQQPQPTQQALPYTTHPVLPMAPAPPLAYTAPFQAQPPRLVYYRVPPRGV